MERHEAELEITGGRERLRDGRKERRKGRRRWQGGKTKSGRGGPGGGGMALWEEMGRDWSMEKIKRELIKEKISEMREGFPLWSLK